MRRCVLYQSKIMTSEDIWVMLFGVFCAIIWFAGAILQDSHEKAGMKASTVIWLVLGLFLAGSALFLVGRYSAIPTAPLSLDDIEKLTSGIESLVTAIGIVVAGIWTYSLFVKNRLDKPSAKISHKVEYRRIPENEILIHVAVHVANTSDVLLRIVSGEVRVTPMLPMADEILGRLHQWEDMTKEGEGEIHWPGRKTYKIDWVSKSRQIEPKEDDTFHFDFVLDRSVSTFQVYSYIENTEKKTIGWNTTTLHDIEATL